MTKNRYRTNFLFPNNSGLIGAGSIFNIPGNYFEFNLTDSDREADFKALKNDWAVIGNDILDTIKKNPKNSLHLLQKKSKMWDDYEDQLNLESSGQSQVPREKSVDELLKGLPDENKTEVQALITAISIRELFNSPIPPPQVLKGYNEIIHDGAERILVMAEKQSDHRITMERTVISKEQDQSGKGQNYGLIVALSFLAVSGILIYNGHEISGTVLGSIDLIGLVSVFVFGKYYQKKKMEEK